MARRRQARCIDSSLNLDSLMDILTCSVGVMVITVVLALMDARSAAVNVTLPLAQTPPVEAVRKILLCKEGRVRLFDFTYARQLLVNGQKVSYRGLPNLVQRANNQEISDAFFNYRFRLKEWSSVRGNHRGVEMIVEGRVNAHGFDLAQLKEDPSEFEALFHGLSESTIWIAFLVDEQSIPVFREARAIVNKMGIRTGWDPGRLKFPYRVMVIGGGRSRSSRAPRGLLQTTQN